MSFPFTIIDPQGNIKSNIHRFIRMTPLASQPLVGKRIRDEFDLIESLEVIKDAVHDTHNMVGKRKYKNEDYNFAQQVRGDLEEYLIGGRDEYLAAIAKNRNQLMYRLVIDPVIESLEQFDHQWALSNADQVITSIINYILSTDIPTSLSDAEAAKQETAAIIDANLQNIINKKRTRKTSRTKKQDEVLTISDDIDVVVDYLPDAES